MDRPGQEGETLLERGPAPLRHWRRLRLRRRPPIIGEVFLVVTLMVVYDRLRSVSAVDATAAVDHGLAILHDETLLHLRFEDGLNAGLAGQPILRDLAAVYYQFLHETVALSVLGVCYVRHPSVYRPARNALVLTNVIGLVVFALYPVAPPRLLAGSTFVDVVAAAGFGADHGAITADQYGAMPSLHLAWATWTALTVCAMTGRRWLRLLAATHVLLTGLIVVATGNHYVLDVVVGTMLGAGATAVTSLLARRTRAPLAELA